MIDFISFRHVYNNVHNCPSPIPKSVATRATRRRPVAVRVYSGDELMPSCLSVCYAENSGEAFACGYPVSVELASLLGAGAALNKVAGRSVEGRHSVV